MKRRWILDDQKHIPDTILFTRSANHQIKAFFTEQNSSFPKLSYSAACPFSHWAAWLFYKVQDP